MAQDDVYPIKDVQGRSTDQPYTSLLDTHHPDPCQAPVAATRVLVFLIMGAESVRNM